jgi:putative peptide zinc metalloprotease protein
VVTAAHVAAAYAHVRQQVDGIAQRTRRPKPFGLWFRVRFLPMSAVAWLSRQLSRLLHPAAAVPLTLLILAAIPVLAAGGSGHHNMMDPGAAFLPVLVLFMVSMFAHELGHASASVRYGAPARDIGVGLYLIYPVFYNDVTSAWGLTRRQRLVIDLAGVFFQFIVGAVYALLHHLTGWQAFDLAAVSVFLLGWLVLLPIFKFDGYWLLTDLLGVVNLSRQVRRVAVQGLRRVRRQRGEPLPWPTWVSAAVLLYGAFSVVFIFVFVLRIALALPGIAAEYPARVGGLMRDLSASPHTPAPGRLSSILGPTYVLIGVTFASIRLGMRLVDVVRPAVVARRTRGAAAS